MTNSEQYNNTMIKPIFEYFPELESQLPCFSFADLPSPVENITLESHSKTKLRNLWIKRDDLSHCEYGGNKVRKLEFILAKASALNKQGILSFGAIGSNHGVATALFANKFKLKTKMLLFKQNITPVVLNNLRLMKSLGVEIEYREGIFDTAAHFYLQSILSSKQTYSLFAGGSNIEGCIGFINAAFELKQQVVTQQCPEPDYLYCPVGSSSTAAGLTLGCALAGLKTRVIGIRVAPSHLGLIPSCTQNTVRALMLKTYKHLRHLTPAIHLTKLPAINLNNQYYGSGYGESTDAGDQAIHTFASHGIQLESTYTAKAAAACLHHANKEQDKTFLYWHTFNSRDTSHLLKENIDTLLPPALQKLVAQTSIAQP
jgi:1-aminocyclopropane-1-carboxylate deaminase/D-cysteine desulfhydrase-like pyridoxal-dependent ACC family enzyme